MKLHYVYLVYREVRIPGGLGWYKKVERIFRKEENAEKFSAWAVKNWDEKFGVIMQQWILDDEFLLPAGEALDITAPKEEKE